MTARSMVERLDLLEHAAARHDRMLTDFAGRLEALELSQRSLMPEVKALAVLGAADRALVELRDRHEQLAARFRILEQQSAGE